MSRVGHALLWLGGLVLAALMAYTLVFDSGTAFKRPAVSSGSPAVDVAVFYPERILWQEFRQGVRLCVRKGLANPVEETDTAVVVATPLHKRKVRFTRHDVRGLRETKDEVRRLASGPEAPLAVVGSSNTVLTSAIAEGLRSATVPEGSVGPILLIPWASAVLAGRPTSGEGAVGLLDILPGRTFRFCPNNQYQADLIVRCLVDLDREATPRRAVIVVDRRDPYSVDLAACFRRAIERVSPDTKIVERAEPLSLPLINDPSMLPGPAEEGMAEAIWNGARELAPGQTVLVVLPLQAEPTQRMISALQKHARLGLTTVDGPLRVVCGDGIGFSVLNRLAGRYTFPVWCGSSASVPAAERALGQGISPDTQVPAEIVSALVRSLDLPDGRTATAAHLRDAVASIHLDANSPAAIGRSLAFSRSGERVGDDLGHVLVIRPGRKVVDAISRVAAGRWSEPLPLATSPVVALP